MINLWGVGNEENTLLWKWLQGTGSQSQGNILLRFLRKGIPKISLLVPLKFIFALTPSLSFFFEKKNLGKRNLSWLGLRNLPLA